MKKSNLVLVILVLGISIIYLAVTNINYRKRIEKYEVMIGELEQQWQICLPRYN